MKKVIILATAVLLIGAFLILKKWENPSRAEQELSEGRSPSSSGQAAGAASSDDATLEAKFEKELSKSPLDQAEKDSISSLLQLMAAKEKLGSSPENLFTAMGEVGLTPRAARDSNPYTGTMLIVRTSNALPGTRYFHAQIFQDEGQPGHMQHTSFEIRPASDSMKTALSLVQQTHPQLGVPEIQNEDYVLWKTNGRVVSIKRLNAEDLEDNHFNAHSPDDVGAVWVVSEDEPGHS